MENRFSIKHAENITNQTLASSYFDSQGQLPMSAKLIHGYEVVIGFETHTQLATTARSSAAPDGVWRRAQHPGLRRGPGPARHAARDESGSRRLRYQTGAGPGLPLRQ